MGLMSKLKGLAGKHEDKTDAAIEKAGDVVDDKTDGKHAAQVDEVQKKADDVIE